MYWMPKSSTPEASPKPTKKATGNLPKMLTQECPLCHVKGAYVGLSHRAECINPACSNFSQKWVDDYNKMVAEHESREEKIEVEAKTLLSEEFGLDWNENEVTTQDMVNMLLP